MGASRAMEAGLECSLVRVLSTLSRSSLAGRSLELKEKRAHRALMSPCVPLCLAACEAGASSPYPA